MISLRKRFKLKYTCNPYDPESQYFAGRGRPALRECSADTRLWSFTLVIVPILQLTYNPERLTPLFQTCVE